MNFIVDVTIAIKLNLCGESSLLVAAQDVCDKTMVSRQNWCTALTYDLRCPVCCKKSLKRKLKLHFFNNNKHKLKRVFLLFHEQPGGRSAVE